MDFLDQWESRPPWSPQPRLVRWIRGNAWTQSPELMHFLERRYGSWSAEDLATETGVSLLSDLTLTEMLMIPTSDADRLRLVGQLWDEVEGTMGETDRWERRILPPAIALCETPDSSSSTNATEPIPREGSGPPSLEGSLDTTVSIDDEDRGEGAEAVAASALASMAGAHPGGVAPG